MTGDWTFYPVKDEPIENASMLGTSKTINTMYGFLTSKSLISPFVIAINGEWGSGKTSLIMTLKKMLVESGFKTAFFDAWKYEYTDTAAALVYDVSRQLVSKKAKLKQIPKQLGKLALDVFTRSAVDIPLNDIERHFQSSVKAVTDLSRTLEKFVKNAVGSEKKVVVFIDDLDRCSLENVIQVLEAIKLFFNVRNLVFVMAIDIDKVKLAWSSKYGRTESLDKEGLRYLEKIIQLQIGLPQPTPTQLQEYVSSIFPSMPKNLVELISLTDLDNPRRIKRLLNLISLRCNIEGESVGKREAAVLWTVLEAMKWSYSTDHNIAYLYQLFTQDNNRTGFYDLISEISRAPVQALARDFTNNPKYKLISEHQSDPKKVHRYMTIVHEMIKDIDREKILTSLEEVVSFANERRLTHY